MSLTNKSFNFAMKAMSGWEGLRYWVVLASLSFATDSTYVSAVVVKAGDNGSRRWS